VSKAPTRSGRTLHCAIYTRKSSEERPRMIGVDQGRARLLSLRIDREVRGALDPKSLPDLSPFLLWCLSHPARALCG
jgi:hypothetical protein